MEPMVQFAQAALGEDGGGLVGREGEWRSLTTGKRSGLSKQRPES